MDGEHDLQVDHIRFLQDQILAKTERRTGTLPASIVAAFRKFPRHLFADRYRDHRGRPWFKVDRENLNQHLEAIYRDQPLVIWGEQKTLSTISQPSFVLFLLKLMDLHPGDRVFELGAGSGWNAALMGAICEPGQIYSYEIIPELAVAARNRIANFGLRNVHIVLGDGMDIPEGMNFNRGIFTAGASDLPSCLFKAMEDGGRLLFVFKYSQSTDLLLVLKKTGNEFVSEQIFECGFVPVTGPYGAGQESETPQSSRPLSEARSVRIVPSGTQIELNENEILISRPQSQFIWSF